MISSKCLPSSDATRPKPGILTPSSTASLDDESNASASASRKRKRDSSTMEDLLKPTITLTAHPPKLLEKPTVLQPLMILAREHVPLSYLDLVSPSGRLPPSRFYESHVRILDLENRRGGGPYLLIARSDKAGDLYAVEGYERGLYTACRLGSWVELGKLRSRATISCRQLLDAVKTEPGDERAARPLTTPGLHKANAERRTAIEALQSTIRGKRRQSISTPASVADGELTPPAITTDLGPPSINTQEPMSTQECQSPLPPLPVAIQPCVSLPPPSGEELLERIRSQYFEALYRSKGSLAYFPKGSLSRARAAFHLESDVNLNMADLVSFLKGLIVPVRQMNKKYQETIPNIIKDMKTLVESSGDDRRKKRRARKMKLGRDGLFPPEEDHLRSWWAANKPELKDGEPGVPETQIKSHISLLRSRETQLQIILILEILALEPLVAAAEAVAPQLPGVQPSIEAEQTVRKPKGGNLKELVELNADLLCIWQSTASDEFRLLEDSQVSDVAREGQKAQRTSSEPLKDFCVDVISPFFSSRLPQLCDSLNRKLGGPRVLSSPRPKQSKPKTPAKQPRPGAVTRRPVASRNPRSLQRAFSTDQAQRDRRSKSRGPSKAVAALLSATEMAIPGLKTEGGESQQSMAGIPRMKSDCGLLKATRPHSLSRSVSMTGDDPRHKKKALIEAELRGAIAAVKRPDRQLAGSTMVEAAERRVSGSLSQMRKTRKPVRVSPSDHVQVMATPMHNRYRDLTGGHLQTSAIAWPLSRSGGGGADGMPPSSNPSVIPSTAPRTSFRDALQDAVVVSTPARPCAAAAAAAAADDRLEETPARGRAAAATITPVRRSVGPADSTGAFMGSSPLMMKRLAPGPGPGPAPDAVGVRSLRDVFRTPVKSRPAMCALEPQQEGEGGKGGVKATPDMPKKVSVYERLGWDDELDDL